jgi:hypothetical protein
MPVVDVGHNLTRPSTERYLTRFIRSVLMSQPFTKLRSVQADRRETDVRSASSGMDAPVLKYFEDPRLLNSPNSSAMSREFLRGSRYTATIMASSLAGVCTVGGQHAFMCALDVTLVSWRSYSSRRNTLASG